KDSAVIYITDPDNPDDFKEVGDVDLEEYFEGGNVDFNVQVETTVEESKTRNAFSNYVGVKFSNIEKPESIGGKKVIGFYIVRHERRESDKTILDSTVLTPIGEFNSSGVNYKGFGMMSMTIP